MSRKISVSIALAITIIAMTVTFSITWLLSMSTFDNTVSAVTRLQAEYAKLAEIDSYVRGNYYGTIDDTYLFDNVAAGYIDGLGDRYSEYYTEQEYTQLLAIEDGTLVGIGIVVVRNTDGTFTISRVYEDSPAARAGVEAMGTLVSINGQDARSSFSSASAVQSALYGEEGTEVELVCLYNLTEEQTFTVRRVPYAPPTVESIIVGDYAYIRISSFTPNTFIDFDFAVRQAQNENVKGFLFDVRNTSEGQFRDVYSLIDLLAPRGTVAKSQSNTGVVSVLATSDESFVEQPMVVLVDENTAGAAELFAVSVRDLCDGQVLGATTSGKGSIQSAPRRMSDGSAVTITTAMLLTGLDQSFDGVGIAPDVELPEGVVTPEMLITPTPTTDPHALRAFEALRSMVRDSGEDPGEAIVATNNQTEEDGDESAAEDETADEAADSSTADGEETEDAAAEGDATEGDAAEGDAAEGDEADAG